MKSIDVKVKCNSKYGLPEYATTGSSGLDICADIPEFIILNPGDRKLISTGLYVAIPEGFELQIRPRSGLALKNGITVLNTPGTIDSDYRQEVCVIVANFGNESFTIKPGDRICQGVFAEVIKARLLLTDNLDETARKGGFGSTGIN